LVVAGLPWEADSIEFSCDQQLAVAAQRKAGDAITADGHVAADPLIQQLPGRTTFLHGNQKQASASFIELSLVDRFVHRGEIGLSRLLLNDVYRFIVIALQQEQQGKSRCGKHTAQAHDLRGLGIAMDELA